MGRKEPFFTVPPKSAFTLRWMPPGLPPAVLFGNGCPAPGSAYSMNSSFSPALRVESHDSDIPGFQQLPGLW